ncbi:hypothetical protein BD779DRAFT_1467786 [Infundibulicybe gibba]|nr:hypothetical protein BD779DRAFT_1467786 [Infundibulicybe gibba]
MTAIPDDNLFQHASRVKDKVVVITGAASGIGKEAALRFASHGAKVIIGDLNASGGEATAQEINAAGGDSGPWILLYVPNAGVAEAGQFENVQFKDGKPVKPNMLTINVNLIGVIYTTHLALHYLGLNRSSGSLKAVILLGSMASWSGIPRGGMYSASKHAVLGMMRSLYPTFALKDIRIASIHPFFADTAIVPVVAKLFLAGIPLTPVPRIAGAIFYAATSPDPETNGCAWLLPDDGPVFLVPREEFKLGVYKMIDDRANRLIKGASGVAYYYRLARDLTRILGKPIFIAGLVSVAAKVSWDNQGILFGYLRG